MSTLPATNALGVPTVLDLSKRFWRHVARDPDTDCWLWTGAVMDSGYGRLAIFRGPNLRAHRVAYELLVGPIPEGLVLDHLCRERRCVNPSHLEAVTIGENLRRGQGHTARNAAKTHCPAGHPYNHKNTRIERNGSRKCRACDLARFHARKEAA